MRSLAVEHERRIRNTPVVRSQPDHRLHSNSERKRAPQDDHMLCFIALPNTSY